MWPLDVLYLVHGLLLSSAISRLPVFVKAQSEVRIGGRPLTWGKTVVAAGDYKFFVEIWCRYAVRFSFDFWCGGVVIAQNWVLTAAHCVDVGTNEKRKIQVRFGNMSRDVRRIIRYPNYTHSDDIALVRLMEPLDEQSFAPIALPRPGDDAPFVDAGKKATVITHIYPNATLDGHPNASNADRVIRSEAVIQNLYCYSGKLYPYDFDRQLCSPLNDTDGIFYCPGDSGSPAFVDIKGKPVLIGVMCRRTYFCDDLYMFEDEQRIVMNVFVRIERFMEWILDSVTKNDPTNPTFKEYESSRGKYDKRD